VTALRIRPQADRDVDEAADYYAREANVDVALRFLAAVEETYLRLCAHPLGAPAVSAFNPRLTGLRFCPVSRFESYLVFYVPSPALVEVVRVLHGARDLPHLVDSELFGE
jgi:toxin ParE1/3/4